MPSPRRSCAIFQRLSPRRTTYSTVGVSSWVARVSSKKRDDLQAVIALVKQQDYDFAVQFSNYR